VTPYDAIKRETELEDKQIKENLIHLIANGIVKVYQSADKALESEAIDMEERYRSYSYLASKKGLFVHNQR